MGKPAIDEKGEGKTWKSRTLDCEDGQHFWLGKGEVQSEGERKMSSIALKETSRNRTSSKELKKELNLQKRLAVLYGGNHVKTRGYSRIDYQTQKL